MTENHLPAVFNFQNHEVRTVTDEQGNPWWIAKDVCDILGYKDTVNAIKAHCRGVANYHPIFDALGRDQETRIINEPDLYRLISKSKLPAAVKFESWIFEEVLPAIRKTGIYNHPNHQDTTCAPDLTHNFKALYPNAPKYLEIMNMSSTLNTQLCQTISDTFADYIKEINANTSGTSGAPRRPANPINPINTGTPLKKGNTWQDIKAKKSKRNTITMSESQVIEQIQTLTAPQKKRLFFILRLLKQKNQTADKLSQSELAEQLKINRKTIHNDMVMLIAGGLVKTNRGYCPTAAFPMFFERLMGE